MRAAAPREIVDIHELLTLVDIADLIFHEERGRRIVRTDEDLASLELPMTVNSLGTRAESTMIRFRFRTVFSDVVAEYVADAEIVYESSEEVTVGEELQREFAERVAFMALYPFLRASVNGSAMRLGLPAPLLGIVRQGEFEFGDKMSEQEVVEAFGDIRSELA